ncbi:MAG: right-handed parallel beta-helix repeat-containing protein [Deltaproteobacteria bacterium]
MVPSTRAAPLCGFVAMVLTGSLWLALPGCDGATARGGSSGGGGTVGGGTAGASSAGTTGSSGSSGASGTTGTPSSGGTGTTGGTAASGGGTTGGSATGGGPTGGGITGGTSTSGSTTGGTGRSGCPPPASATSADFYVATDGQDSWSGTLAAPSSSGTNGPFATLGRAASAAAGLLASSGGRTTPIVVLVRGGRYALTAPIQLGASDSGSAAVPIVYAAYPNESPVFSGGVAVSGWRQLASGGWQTSSAGLAPFAQLFVNGSRRYRPTTTPQGYLYNQGPVIVATKSSACPTAVTGGYECFDRFRFSAGDLSPAWANPTDIEIDDFEDWTMSRMRLSSVDATNLIAYLTGPTYTSAQFHGFIYHHRYLAENVKEALSQPGQWYQDIPSSTLTYLPLAGEAMATAEVIAPQATQLLVANGLSHVTFRGLTFSHQNWTVPAAGHPSGQGEQDVPAALSFQGCDGIVLDGCTLSELGGWGVEFVGAGGFQPTSQAPYAVQVVGSTLTDLGTGGIRIGRAPSGSDTESNVAQHVLVQNSLLSGLGRLLPQGTPIWIGNSHDDLVDHCEIWDSYNVGISIGFSFDYVGSLAHDDVVQWTLLHDLGQGVTSDIGGLYTLVSTATGTILQNNVIHDVTHDPGNPAVSKSAGYGGWGIYFDQGTSNVLAENNLVYRTSQTGFKQNYGEANRAKNNIFAFGMLGQVERTHDEDHLSFTFENNLVYWDRAALQYGAWSCQDLATGAQVPCTNRFLFQSNLYWDLASTPLFLTQSPTQSYDLAGWQAIGEDLGSSVQDPLFVSPAYPNDDFTLRPGSPAASVGFVPFDPSQAGRLACAPTTPPAVPPAFPLQLPAKSAY